MASDDPIILGRFNYLSNRPDLFHVLFMPFRGSLACIVARNLSKEEALTMIGDLNGAIDDMRRDLAEREDESVEGEF